MFLIPPHYRMRNPFLVWILFWFFYGLTLHNNNNNKNNNNFILVQGLQPFMNLNRVEFLHSSFGFLGIIDYDNNDSYNDNDDHSIFLHDNQDYPGRRTRNTLSSTTQSTTTLLSSSNNVNVNNNVNDNDLSLCRNGALVPEQAIPGAYNQVCMTLPEREIPITVTTTTTIDDTTSTSTTKTKTTTMTIYIQQEPSGSGRTGMAVWNSGIVLTRLLERLYPIIQSSSSSISTTSTLSILELGCGTGLASIAAYQLWKHQSTSATSAATTTVSVLATDGNPDVVRLAQQNIQRNCQNTYNDNNENNNNNNNNKSSIQATVLPWGVLNAIEYNADIIIGADLTYNSGSWRVLAETMATILNPSGCIIYVTLGHEGFNVNPEMDGFLSVAKEVGGLIPVNEINGISIDSLIHQQDLLLSPVEAKQLQGSGGIRIAILRRKEFLKKQVK